MASYPSYNLNSFVNGLSDAAYKQLNAEGAFNNYAIQGLYTPGSTFKLVTATTELQTGIFPADKLVDDTGTFTVPDCQKAPAACASSTTTTTRRPGEIDLPTALTVSSDYYFYNLGYLFWSQQAKYGQTPIQNVAADYGLTEPTNIDLPDEATEPRGLARGAQGTARRRPRRLPAHDLVHGRQHRDGLRSGIDVARPRSRSPTPTPRSPTAARATRPRSPRRS